MSSAKPTPGAVLLGLWLFCATLSQISAKAVLPAGAGAWFGSVFPPGSETFTEYNSRIGFTPAIFSVFIRFPLDDSARGYLRFVLPQLQAKKCIVMITVEPFNGLSGVTSSAASELATYIRQAEQVCHLHV